MANIFALENFDDFSERLNIDDLYEKKRNHDIAKLTLFNKILNRVHVRIKTTSKQRLDDTNCWFVVPEIIIGVPKYDQAGCIAYIVYVPLHILRRATSIYIVNCCIGSNGAPIGLTIYTNHNMFRETLL